MNVVFLKNITNRRRKIIKMLDLFQHFTAVDGYVKVNKGDETK
jgi:hypothetical protein